VDNAIRLIKLWEMTRFTAFVIIVTLRIFYHPSGAHKETAPFTGRVPNVSFLQASWYPASASSVPRAKIISVYGAISHQRVILNSKAGENESAAQAETDHYRFYEKAARKRTLYRIRLMKTNRQAEYSSVFEITPPI